MFTYLWQCKYHLHLSYSGYWKGKINSLFYGIPPAGRCEDLILRSSNCQNLISTESKIKENSAAPNRALVLHCWGCLLSCKKPIRIKCNWTREWKLVTYPHVDWLTLWRYLVISDKTTWVTINTAAIPHGWWFPWTEIIYTLTALTLMPTHLRAEWRGHQVLCVGVTMSSA